MESKEFVFEGNRINYYRHGEGDKVLLAFHGFGLTGASFEPIAMKLDKQYTIYSFDLFYHGKSHWHDNNQSLSKAYWSKIIEAFLTDHRITKFSILAFSLGGKFTFTLVEKLPGKIEHLYLLAPDGIQTQMWYNLATYPVAFQQYFRSMIVKPSRFLNILDLVNRMGLLDKGISKFAASQMNTVKKRRRVYYSWIVFKSLTFDIRKLAVIMNQHNISLDLYLGRFDKIITRKGMTKFTNLLNKVKVHQLDCGHNNLIEHTAAFLDQND